VEQVRQVETLVSISKNFHEWQHYEDSISLQKHIFHIYIFTKNQGASIKGTLVIRL